MKNPVRRSFSPEYKLSILAEYDRASETGEKGAILRREGLYSSLITDWRRQHRQGLLKAAVGRSDGGRGGPSCSEVAKLRVENERVRMTLTGLPHLGPRQAAFGSNMEATGYQEGVASTDVVYGWGMLAIE